MVGCSTAPTFIRTDFDKTHIRSIAIMPVSDKRNVSEDSKLAAKNVSDIEKSLSETLIEKKYDVLSADSIKIKTNSIQSGKMTQAQLCSMLNVDAILYSDLYDFSDVFLVNHSLKMSYKMFDAKGDSLWLNNMDDMDRPFVSAIGSTLSWGIGVSTDNNISSADKLPTILAGVAAAELVYAAVDGLSNEMAQSINKVFHSLPEKKGISR